MAGIGFLGCRGFTGGGPTVEPAAPGAGCDPGNVFAGDDFAGGMFGRPCCCLSVDNESLRAGGTSPPGFAVCVSICGPWALARARRSADVGVWSGSGGFGAGGAGRLAVSSGLGGAGREGCNEPGVICVMPGRICPLVCDVDIELVYWTCEPLTSSAARARAAGVLSTPFRPAGAESWRIIDGRSSEVLPVAPPSPVPALKRGVDAPSLNGVSVDVLE